MIEFYSEIRLVHIAAVLISGALFAVRGAALFFGAAWPMSIPVRFTTWTVDTVLLTAALMLMTLVQQYPFVDGWLTMKVVLIVAYVALGHFAFRRCRTPAARVACWLAALAVYAFVFSVARAHHPLGVFSS